MPAGYVLEPVEGDPFAPELPLARPDSGPIAVPDGYVLEPIDYDPFADPDEAFTKLDAVVDTAKGLARTVRSELPSMVGGALQGFDVQSQGWMTESGAALHEWGENTPEWMEADPRRLALKRSDPLSLKASIPEAAEMLGPSLAIPMTGAAIGSIVPGVGTLAGGAAGFLANVLMFGGATAQDTYERGYEHFIEEGKSPDEAHDLAFRLGRTTGAIEAGGEAVADIVTFKLYRYLPEPIKSNVVRAATKAIRSPKEMVKSLASVVATEVGTELGQTAAQLAVEEHAGLDSELSWENLKPLLVPIAIVALVTMGAGETVGALRRRSLANTLADPDAPPTKRAAAIKEVAEEVGAQDPELANIWLRHSISQFKQGRPIVAREDDVYREAGASFDELRDRIKRAEEKRSRDQGTTQVPPESDSSTPQPAPTGPSTPEGPTDALETRGRAAPHEEGGYVESPGAVVVDRASDAGRDGERGTGRPRGESSGAGRPGPAPGPEPVPDERTPDTPTAAEELEQLSGLAPEDQLLEMGRSLVERQAKRERDRTAANAPNPQVRAERAHKKREALNPEVDDVLAAVAKLGGIHRETAVAHGIDPAEMNTRVRRFGRNQIFTKEGAEPEAIAQILADHGYPVLNEDGNYTEDAIMSAVEEAMRGKRIVSKQGIDREMEAQREGYERNEELRALDEEMGALVHPEEMQLLDEVEYADLTDTDQRVLYDAMVWAEDLGLDPDEIEEVVERGAIQELSNVEIGAELARRAQTATAQRDTGAEQVPGESAAGRETETETAAAEVGASSAQLPPRSPTVEPASQIPTPEGAPYATGPVLPASTEAPASQIPTPPPVATPQIPTLPPGSPGNTPEIPGVSGANTLPEQTGRVVLSPDWWDRVPEEARAEIPDTLYRGHGREEVGSVYGPGATETVDGVPIPVLGMGRYYAMQRNVAERFGPDVEELSLFDLTNPLIITDDTAWAAYARRSGWDYPNPSSRGLETRLAEVKGLADAMKRDGYDSILITMPVEARGDGDGDGRSWKLLRRVFSDPQVFIPAATEQATGDTRPPQHRGEALELRPPSPSNTAPTPAAPDTTGDMFGDDTRTAQGLADEQRRKDAARSGSLDLEAGGRGDLFDERTGRQTDIGDAATAPPPSPLRLAPRRADETPPPEPLGVVPQKYLDEANAARAAELDQFTDVTAELLADQPQLPTGWTLQRSEKLVGPTSNRGKNRSPEIHLKAPDGRTVYRLPEREVHQRDQRFKREVAAWNTEQAIRTDPQSGEEEAQRRAAAAFNQLAESGYAKDMDEGQAASMRDALLARARAGISGDAAAMSETAEMVRLLTNHHLEKARSAYEERATARAAGRTEALEAAGFPDAPEYVRRVLDTENADDQAIGNVGRLEHGRLVGTHITDNPESVRDALAAGNIAIGSSGDLGPGLYMSDAPGVWISQSTGMWDFFDRISREQETALTERVGLDIAVKGDGGHISERDAERAQLTIEGIRAGTLSPKMLSDYAAQPYNIELWRPEYLEAAGIDPGTEPQEVPMAVTGKFAELSREPTRDEAEDLRRRGFDGAYTIGGFGTLPQLVAWNPDAVVRFGGRATERPLVEPVEAGAQEAFVRRFASGMTRPRDFKAGIASGQPIGIEIGEISGVFFEEMAGIIASNPAAEVFVDSGAFRLFTLNLKAKAAAQQTLDVGEMELDFGGVLAKYHRLVDAVEAAGGSAGQLYMVMPDRVGDQAGTLALLEQHIEAVLSLQDSGAEIIVPVQRDGLSPAEAYTRTVEIMLAGGSNTTFRVGIPSNEEAMTDAEVADLAGFSAGQFASPSRFHILGSASGPRLESRIRTLQENTRSGVELDISADANQIRSHTDQMRGLAGPEKFDALRNIIAGAAGYEARTPEATPTEEPAALPPVEAVDADAAPATPESMGRPFQYYVDGEAITGYAPYAPGDRVTAPLGGGGVVVNPIGPGPLFGPVDRVLVRMDTGDEVAFTFSELEEAAEGEAALGVTPEIEREDVPTPLSLETLGLTVTASQTTPKKAGKRPRDVWTVTGRTKGFEEAFRGLGGRKYGGEWSFFEDPSDSLLDEIEAMGGRLSFADQLETKRARGIERAERYEDWADSARKQSTAAYDRSSAAVEGIPMGQPILVGHHSEKRHRAAVDRSARAMDKSVEHTDRARGHAFKAASARHQAEREYTKPFVHNRIKESKAELRRVHKHLERDYTEEAYYQGREGSARLAQWLDRQAQLKAELAEKITYWEGQLDQLGGVTYARDNVSKGDVVRIRGAWSEVIRANPKTVKIRILTGGAAGMELNYPYAEITQHKSAAEMAAGGTETEVDQAANEGATSIANDKPEPTEGEIEADNYEKGHPPAIAGLQTSIETAAGSLRNPAWPPLTWHYGHAIGTTKGADGEAIDVFIKPGTPADWTGTIYVVDQADAGGSFDEHKVMVGADSLEDARSGYRSNYEGGWERDMGVQPMDPTHFKAWSTDEKNTRYPAVYTPPPGTPANHWEPAPSSSGTDTWSLLDTTNGTRFGTMGPYWKQVEAADQHNRDLVEAAKRRNEEHAKYPALEWSKEAPTYRKTLRSETDFARYPGRPVGWIAQAYEHRETVYWNPDTKRLERISPVSTYGHKRTVHVIDANEYGDALTFRENADSREALAALSGVDAQPLYNLDALRAVSDRIDSGEITPEELLHEFDVAAAGRGALAEEIGGMTKSQILKRWPGAGRFRNERKARLIDHLVSSLLSTFSVQGGYSMSMGEDPIVAQRRSVSQATAEDIAKNAADTQAQRAALDQRRQEALKGISNPETLSEFDDFIRFRGDDKLTPEQRVRYEELRAEAGLEQRASERSTAGTVAAVSTDVEMSLSETVHTKKGYPLFVVQLADRVDRPAFVELRERAKQLGGWYSAYNKGGALPGFQFKDRDPADTFMALRSGDVETADTSEARRTEASERAASKLHDVADRMRERAEEALGADRKTNTPRRAAQANATEGQARTQLARAETLTNLAAAVDAGSTRFLQRINAVTQLDTLDDRIRNGALHADKAVDWKYTTSNQRDVPIEEAIAAAVMPYPFLSKADLVREAGRVQEAGGKQLAIQLRARAKTLDHADRIYRFDSKADVDLVAKVVKKQGSGGWRGADWRLADQLEHLTRLRRMEIEDVETLRAALREYVQFRGQKPEVDPAVEAERALAGRKIEGFVPTPPAVVESMMAELSSADLFNRLVLEPSAGTGNIADALRARGGPDAPATDRYTALDVVEINGELRDILTQKGHNVVAADFLTLPDRSPSRATLGEAARYDTIVMNPPFEAGQDIDHVRRAFDMVRPGGKVVAIMSEGPFYRQDAKATEFRGWLEERAGRSEKLDQGAFQDRSQVRTAGVATRLVVLEKDDHRAVREPAEAYAQQSLPFPDGVNADLAEPALQELRRVGGLSVLGNALPAEFRSAGAVSLVGQAVETPQDLATIAQVLRDPRFETLRIYYTRGNELVGENAVTSRLPGTAYAIPAGVSPNDHSAQLREEMARLGADGFYMLHNHPSGHPNPSRLDLEHTYRMSRELPGFKGHVVINDGRFAVIDTGSLKLHGSRWGPVGEYELSVPGGYSMFNPTKANPFLYTAVRQPAHLAMLAKQVQTSPEMVVVIGRGAQTRGVVGIAEIHPSQILAETERDQFRIASTLNRFRLQSGSVDLFLVNVPEGYFPESMRAIESGLVVDVIGTDGTSLHKQGIDATETAEAGRSYPKVMRVAEEEELYGPSPHQRLARSVQGATEAAVRSGSPIQAGIEYLRSKVSDWRPTWLGTLTRRHLAEIGRDVLPEMTPYVAVAQRMDADRNHLVVEAGEMAERWAGLMGAAPDEADRMASLMHDSTIAGVDPSADEYTPTLDLRAAQEELYTIKDQARGRPGEGTAKFMAMMDTLSAQMGAEKRRRREYPGLRKRYEGLSEEGQSVFDAVRDMYSARFDQVQFAIEARIERADIAETEKTAVKLRLRQHFESQKAQGPYFPLARFGDFWVAVRENPDDDAVVEFRMFETSRAQGAFARKMEEAGYAVEAGKKLENLKAVHGASQSFVTDVIGILKDVGGPMAEDISDQVYQLYLSTLPDLSVRKHFIHRKKIKGFSHDALRAFAHQTFHGSHQLVRLRYSDILADALDTMRLRIQEEPGNRATDLYHEMAKRHEWALNPKSAEWANTATSIGFTWYLGLTPAAAVVNTTQTPLVAAPLMAARYGWAGTGMELMRALGDFMSGGFTIAGADLDPGERRMFDDLHDDGTIEKTLAHDLVGRSETSSAVYGSTHNRVMGIVSYLFHHAERMNREVTALATHRLATQQGAARHEAIDAARETVFESHFDYSNANKARFMQSDVARVLLLFRQFSLNMTYLLTRNAYQTLRGETPEVRRMARRKITGILATHALAAGSMGLPLFWLVESVANAVFDDEDEPYDFETEYRNFLADYFGAQTAHVIARGPVEAMTDIGISQRVSLNELWFRDPDRDLEGEAIVEYWFEQILGPMGQIAFRAGRAYDLMKEGHIMRGIEATVPKVIRDTLRAGRYMEEGVTSLRGDQVVDDVNNWQLFLQLMGFTPGEIALQYDVNRSLKGREGRIKRRRQLLMNRVALFYRMNDESGMADALEQIATFNEANPSVRITWETIRRGMKTRARYDREAIDGVHLDKRLRGLTQDVRYGTDG